ncbi:MAG: MBL fold metallo-hydrolase [Vicinamibacterales bacterium]
MGAPFDGRQFRNQDPTATRGVRDVLRMLFTRRPARWPAHVPNTATPSQPAALADGELAVTFINHATLLVQSSAGAWITDPVFAERASPVQWAGPRRVRAPGMALDDLPPLSFVLLSHNHYDHLDLASLRAIQARDGAPIVTTLGNRAYLRARGLEAVEELDWWDACAPVPGAHVTLTPAQHFSARTPFDRNRTLWGGFVVRTAAGAVYFAGDTGYGTFFSEIRDRLGAPDLAFLPIGAYAPRWFMGPLHMDPADAVRAHLDLGAGRSVAMHFGCFQLTDEGFDAPVAALAEARAAATVDSDAFRVLAVGETWRTRLDAGGR